MSETESGPAYDPEFSEEYWPGEWVPREAIEPNDWNPNELSDADFQRLVDSIADNGWTMPIVVHAEERYIIDGEHRWEAATHLPDDPELTPDGVPSDHVPVYGITVDEQQAKLATVQHNRARGDVQVSKLQDYLSDLQDRGVLSSVHDRIGYSEDDASELLGELETPDIPDETMPWEEDEEDDDDEAETVEEAPIPDLHEDRTVALRADSLSDEVMENVESVQEALTASEYELVCEALGNETRAQSLVNLCRYVETTDSLDDVSDYAS